MSIVVRFNPTNVTQERYAESLRLLEAAGDWPPEGLEYHIFFGADNDLRVSEVWDSQEQFEAYGSKLMPILQKIGIEFSGPPEIFEVHNTIKR